MVGMRRACFRRNEYNNNMARDTFLLIILCTPDSRSTRQGRSVVPGSESDRNDQKSQTAEVGGVVLVAAAWRLPNHEDL